MYTVNDLVKIAKRENNQKRTYLVVDPLQGKHVPVSPKKALALFEVLGQQLEQAYPGERLLLVGFAETATAIGAAIAVQLGCTYIQTTRENVPGAQYLYFSESHSHATEQRLVKNELADAVSRADRIVFIEDEVTTGNTILKIVHILQKEYGSTLHFSAASLLNGMNEAALAVYAGENIGLHYVLKTLHDKYADIAARFEGQGMYTDLYADMCSHAAADFTEYSVRGYINTRRPVDGRLYLEACRALAKETVQQAELPETGDILVLGTEECMYPALFTAAQLEAAGRNVRCHATTRSPIMTDADSDYPLHSRYALCSFYDENRKTFIYDLKKYAAVLIITDAPQPTEKGKQTLACALSMCGSDSLYLIKWGE